MYPNSWAAAMLDDVWHCYDKMCGTMVVYAHPVPDWPWRKPKIESVRQWPRLITLDEELERIAETLL
jgi:hypothetical protein